MGALCASAESKTVASGSALSPRGRSLIDTPSLLVPPQCGPSRKATRVPVRKELTLQRLVVPTSMPLARAMVYQVSASW